MQSDGCGRLPLRKRGEGTYCIKNWCNKLLLWPKVLEKAYDFTLVLIVKLKIRARLTGKHIYTVVLTKELILLYAFFSVDKPYSGIVGPKTLSKDCDLIRLEVLRNPDNLCNLTNIKMLRNSSEKFAIKNNTSE